MNLTGINFLQQIAKILKPKMEKTSLADLVIKERKTSRCRVPQDQGQFNQLFRTGGGCHVQRHF